MNPDSEQILNRFAAGEMSLEEESDFLAYCEIEPERYRRAMLAMLEHRRMGDALRAFAFPEGDDEKTSDADIKRESPPAPARERPRSRVSASGLAIAALISGIAIGWVFKSDPSGVAENPGSAGLIADGSASPPSVLDTEETPLKDEWIRPLPQSPSTLAVQPQPQAAEFVNDSPEDRLAPALAQLLAEMRAQPVFTEEPRRRLRESGWEVEEEPLIYLFETGDGQQYAVPSRNTNIRFVKQ